MSPAPAHPLPTHAGPPAQLATSAPLAPRGHPEHPARRVILLGATGSIGRQTLDVLEHLNRLSESGERRERFEVVAMASGRDAGGLAAAAARWGTRRLALADPSAAPQGQGWETGPDAAERLVRTVEADVVVSAIVGAGGLSATLAAAQLGLDIALANKETLVAAGALVTAACAKSGARLLPVDSEHAAAWQCLRGLAPADATPPMSPPPALERLILTASGGAFRDRTRAEVHDAPPEAALQHPTWSMGAKVTIDSATLINKALELIEAHWLFGLPSRRLGAVLHRQSIVHAMAQTADGGLIAHLAPPDMRLPIQAALTAPALVQAPARATLDLAAIGRLDFAPIDPERFPIVGYALGVIDRGGAAGAAFNAAAEACVEAYLAGRLAFGRIDELTARATDQVADLLGPSAGPSGPLDLQAVLEADRLARRAVADHLA